METNIPFLPSVWNVLFSSAKAPQRFGKRLVLSPPKDMMNPSLNMID